MTMEVLPCLSTSLDRMEIDDLRTRIENMISRIMSADDPKRLTPVDGARMNDVHGGITIASIGEGLSLSCSATPDMGSFKLTMPMPVGGDVRTAKAYRLARGDFIRLLHIWLGYLDSVVQGPSGSMVSPGTTRLATCVSAVLRMSNPNVPSGTNLQMTADPPYQAESGERTSARIPAISVGGRPCFAKEVERRILELHPAASIQRVMGNRCFAMTPLDATNVRVVETGMSEMLRTIGNLGLRDIRKPVLKAGLDLE